MQGKGIDALMEAITSNLNRKRILDNTKGDINFTKVGNDIVWNLKCDVTPSEKKVSGMGKDSLERYLDKTFKEKTLRIMPDVLCLVDYTRTSATYLLIEGLLEDDIKQGDIKFEKVEVYGNEYLISKCKETGLALYDDEICYPITEIGINSVGKLMDAIVSFKKIDPIPLGAALLLYGKIQGMKKVDILYENTGAEIKPLYAVCSPNYHVMKNTDFINGIFNLITENKMSYDAKEVIWNITNGVTEAIIPLGRIMTDGTCICTYQPVIKVRCSELPGTANKIELMAKLYEGYISIEERSLLKDTDFNSLLDGFSEKIIDTEKRIGNTKICVSQKDIKELVKIIGQKRFSDDILNLKNNSVDITTFVNKTYRELKWKQARELSLFYKEVMLRNVS